MSRILIVDDSQFQRANLRILLSKQGHHTKEASNGRQALEMLAANPPDCMLLDLTMPDMDGFDVLNVMKRKNLTVPVIVMTADIQDVVRNECLKLGAANVLHKPPRENELQQALSALLKST